MRVAIIGFGLIGGSIARALAAREPGRWHVTAWSRGRMRDSAPGSASDRALAEGVVQAVAVTPEDAARGASAGATPDLVVLAAAPAANVELVARIGPLMAGSGATLTDVTSVQRPMAAAAAAIDGLRFVGGHPMAGREQRGYAAATADLFVDRPWLVLPGAAAQPEDVARVEVLAIACGARPRQIDPQVHDRLVAAISHLPLIVSAAVAEAVTGSPDWPATRELAAGGWRDATRLARGDPHLGAGIASLNRDEILVWLDRLEDALVAWRADLEAGDAVALAARFERVRSTLEDIAR
jgi:prephenate dehydrogenase